MFAFATRRFRPLFTSNLLPYRYAFGTVLHCKGKLPIIRKKLNPVWKLLPLRKEMTTFQLFPTSYSITEHAGYIAGYQTRMTGDVTEFISNFYYGISKGEDGR